MSNQINVVIQPTYLKFHLKLNLTFDMVINSFRRLEKNGAIGADNRGKI